MHITTEVRGNCATLTPRGDIDFEHLDQLRTSLDQLPSTVTDVAWDLRDTFFVDIAGLHLLGTPGTRSARPASPTSTPSTDGCSPSPARSSPKPASTATSRDPAHNGRRDGPPPVPGVRRARWRSAPGLPDRRR
ncbi:STAS domain-containing protein [Streptomyces zhihengii]